MKVSPICLVLLMSYASVSLSETLQEAIINDIMPDSSSQCIPSPGGTSHTFAFESSQEDSKWFEGWPGESEKYGAPWSNLEQYVFSAKMTHTDSKDDRDWTLRLGTGGNIYSFYTKAGEIIAPQKRVESPWIDDVWHSVGTDIGRNNGGGDLYMIHGAGSYQSDQTYTSSKGIPLLDVPFYSQDIGKYCKDEEGECGFASWAQHGPVPVSWESPLINFNRYKDCGNGVFEHTAVHHVNNGSGHYINRFDAPFGSIRDSTLTDMVMTDKSTNSEVLYEQSALGEYSTSPTRIKLEDTLGYSMFGQDLPSPKGGEPFPKPSGVSHTIAMNGCRLTPNLYPHAVVMCKIEPTAKNTSGNRASLRIRGTPPSDSTFVPPCDHKDGSNCMSSMKFLKYGATNSYCRPYPYPDGGEISCRLDYNYLSEFELPSGDNGFVKFSTGSREFTATDGITYWSLLLSPAAKVWHMVFKPRAGTDASMAEIEAMITAAPNDIWNISYFNPPGSGGDVVARKGVIHWSIYFDQYDTYWFYFIPDPVDGVDDIGDYVRTKFPPGSTLEILYDPGKPLDENLGFGHVHGNDFSNSAGVTLGWPIVIIGQGNGGARPRDANFYNIVTTANLNSEGGTHYYRQYFVVDKFPDISATASNFVSEVDHQNYSINDGPSGRVVDLYVDGNTVGATVGGRACGGSPSTEAPSGSPSQVSSLNPTTSPSESHTTPPSMSPTQDVSGFPYPKDKEGNTVVLISAGNVIISSLTYKVNRCILRILLEKNRTGVIKGPKFRKVSLLFYDKNGERTSDPAYDVSVLRFWYKGRRYMEIEPAAPYNTVDKCQEAECLLEKRFRKGFSMRVDYTSNLKVVESEKDIAIEAAAAAASVPTKVCSGSTTPKADSRALYQVKCGSSTYIGPDPYYFSPNDWTGQDKKRPYICKNDNTVRGTWTLLGFFPTGACSSIETGFTYDEDLCSAN